MNLSYYCLCGWHVYDKKWERGCTVQEESCWRIRDERSWINALFSRPASMAEPIRNIYQPGKVCCGNIKKIWYVGLWSHGHTHGNQH